MSLKKKFSLKRFWIVPLVFFFACLGITVFSVPPQQASAQGDEEYVYYPTNDTIAVRGGRVNGVYVLHHKNGDPNNPQFVSVATSDANAPKWTGHTDDCRLLIIVNININTEPLDNPSFGSASAQAFSRPGTNPSDCSSRPLVINAENVSLHGSVLPAGLQCPNNMYYQNLPQRCFSAPTGPNLDCAAPSTLTMLPEVGTAMCIASSQTIADPLPDGKVCPDGLQYHKTDDRCTAPATGPNHDQCAAGTLEVHSDEGDPTVNNNLCVSTLVDSGSSRPTCEDSGDELAGVLCGVLNSVSRFSDWLFNNLLEPFLYTSPVATEGANPSFKIWSTFRIYGDIFLVIAILIIVFGESIGGGLIEAYTVKKVLPRILVTAILINLSIYIVAFAVDITNVVGRTIGDIILAPVPKEFQASTGLSVGGSNAALAGGIIGLIYAFGGMAASFLTALFAHPLAFGRAALSVAGFIVLPVLLAVLIIFFVLIIRKGIILALIVLSPVAFAFYVLPATEKYFRKWWDTLFKTLLLYPVIVFIFAIADLLSVTIVTANNISADSIKDGSVFAALGHSFLGFANMIGFHFAQTPAPVLGLNKGLALVAAIGVEGVFKAGGTIMAVQKIDQVTGMVHAAASRGSQLAGNGLKNRRQQAGHRFKEEYTQGQAQAYRQFGNVPILGGRIRGGRHGDILAKEASMNAEAQKAFDATTGTGDDSEVRALTVNKHWADNHGVEGMDWRMNGTKRQYKTLGGKWVDESSVTAAHKRWGHNQYAMQQAVSYEMRKATTQDDEDYLRTHYGTATEHFTGEQQTGMWVGAAFANQNADRQWKHYGWNEEQGDLRLNGLNLMREIDERQGNWQMTAQSGDTWTSMSQEITRAHQQVQNYQAGQGNVTQEQAIEAQEVLQRGARIVESLRASSYAPTVQGQGDNAQPAAQAPPVGGDRGVLAGASGRAREEANRFASIVDQAVGRYELPSGGTTAIPLPREPMDSSLDRRVGSGRQS